MARFFVRSFPQAGFDGVFTPQKFWPQSGTIVETIDEDDNPIEPQLDKDGKPVLQEGKPVMLAKRTDDGAVLIGRLTLRALQDDTRFAVGVPPADIKKLEETQAENEALKARIAELEAAAAAGSDKKAAKK